MRPLRSQLPVLYGISDNGVWADSAKWLVTVTVPNFLLPYWHFNGQLVRTMRVHREMAAPIYLAWSNINERGLAHLVHSFDGCLAIRASRSDARPSVHSWALAIDINAATNKLGTKGDIDRGLVQCFNDAGFMWGGLWYHPDPMHFQYVTED